MSCSYVSRTKLACYRGTRSQPFSAFFFFFEGSWPETRLIPAQIWIILVWHWVNIALSSLS